MSRRKKSKDRVLGFMMPTATDVLQEFVEDIKLAYGTGIGSQIDAMHMDWPDLERTYEKALTVLGLEPPKKG